MVECMPGGVEKLDGRGFGSNGRDDERFFLTNNGATRVLQLSRLWGGHAGQASRFGLEFSLADVEVRRSIGRGPFTGVAFRSRNDSHPFEKGNVFGDEAESTYGNGRSHRTRKKYASQRRLTALVGRSFR
jgi:hypothetical protein